jgi:hypothetical protein
MSDARMDAIYDLVGAVLDVEEPREDLADLLLDLADPGRMEAEKIVALLIATLGGASLMPSRAAFIERARPVLDAEPEGADAILAGLERPRAPEPEPPPPVRHRIGRITYVTRPPIVIEEDAP